RHAAAMSIDPVHTIPSSTGRPIAFLNPAELLMPRPDTATSRPATTHATSRPSTAQQSRPSTAHQAKSVSNAGKLSTRAPSAHHAKPPEDVPSRFTMYTHATAKRTTSPPAPLQTSTRHNVPKDSAKRSTSANSRARIAAMEAKLQTALAR